MPSGKKRKRHKVATPNVKNVVEQTATRKNSVWQDTQNIYQN